MPKKTRKLIGGVFGTTFLTVVLWVPLTLAAAPKRVLILDSFGPEATPLTIVTARLRATLAIEYDGLVDIEEDSLEAARFPDPEFAESFAQFLRQRLTKQPFDLVIPIAAPAMKFALEHRAELFPSSPLLLTAGEPRRMPPGSTNNATYVTAKNDLHGIIENVLRLQPETTNIAVVIGSSPTDKFWIAECQREWQQYTNSVRFTFLHEFPLRRICEVVSGLPPRSFIVFLTLLKDGEGMPWGHDEVLSSVHEVANAPLYALFESQVGYGSIGGRMYPDREVGIAAGKAAARILRGEPVESIAPLTFGPSEPIYDWRELNRWRIPLSRLPAGSRIEFREPGFWEQYRGWILTALGVCALQMTLIAGLLINRARLRRSEASAALIADLSTQFVKVRPDQVDSAIEEAQKRICESLDLDLCFLWQWTNGASSDLRLTYLYQRGPGPTTPPHMRAAAYFPWSLRQLKDRRIVSIEKLEDAPPEAKQDVETWRYFGVRATLKIPLYGPGKSVVGALGFHSTRREIVWQPNLVNSLKILSQVFANALERKRIEQQLWESEERLTLAAEAAGAGLWSIQLSTGSWWMTRQAQELFDLADVQDVTFDLFLNCIHPADQARVRNAVEEVMHYARGSWVDFRVVMRDGTMRWIRSQGQVHCSDEGQPESLMGVFIDITEQLASLEALRASERDYRLLFENLRSGLIILEVIFNSAGKPCDHRLLHANREWERQTGFTEKNEKGKVSAELSFKWPVELADCYYQVALTGEPFRGELFDEARNQHYDLRVFSPRKGQFAVMTHDITEQRRVEVEARELRLALTHSGRVNLIGQLASARAHELSQPVGAILRNAEAAQLMLSDTPVDVPELRAIVGDIIRDDLRAGQVIDRLRSLLRQESLDLQPLLLHDLLNEVLSLVQPDAAARNVRLAYFMSFEVPPVRGDRIHLQQVMLNLILNALDALVDSDAKAGLIEVRAKLVEPGTVEVRVVDNGPGLDSVPAGKLFEPFYTTKPNGMGMGLAISKTIIEAHKGKIWAENRPEGGACFCITLPVARQPAAQMKMSYQDEPTAFAPIERTGK